MELKLECIKKVDGYTGRHEGFWGNHFPKAPMHAKSYIVQVNLCMCGVIVLPKVVDFCFDQM